jgi:predicted amidohydrolase YtcJ
MVPDASREASVQAMMNAQEDCFAVGLTTVTDAGFKGGGLKAGIIDLIREMHRDSTLMIRINAMASLDEISRYTEGRYVSEHLMVNGFKAYADGALGSRGACLLEPYEDKPGSHGFLIHEPAKLKEWIRKADELRMQINIHCIGDSAHRFILNEYNNILQGKNPNRWRIEHAQVIDPADLQLYSRSGILPSVQPTHATSDMYWAEERLGSERMTGAYAYKSLLECNGIILNGSDFPVESINPLFGFYAAVVRKDQAGFPENGFLPSQKLSRAEALKAMTIWAAYGAFMEDITGSIEKGKRADFVILDKDLMIAAEEALYDIKILQTWISGKKVYSRSE